MLDMERHFTIQTEQLELAATIHYPERETTNHREERLPLIIICHGFVGNKIGVDRLFVKAARDLCRDGYMVLRFDYGGCGESTGEYGAGGLDDLITQTRYVLDYAEDIDCVDPTRITLLGHSLGGAVALLTAAQDRRVKSLVLWAPVAHPFHDIVKITGKPVYEEAIRTGTSTYLGYSFKPTFFESLAKYHPFEYTRKFSGDVLLIHGTSDDVIPVDYTFLYQKAFWLRSGGICDKEVLFQGDHTFSSGSSAADCIKKTREWLQISEKRKSDWNHWTI
jgi:uncharacterized protein